MPDTTRVVTRSQKKHQAANASSWADLIFHTDLASAFQKHCPHLDTVLKLRCTCKQGQAVIAFMPTQARLLLRERGRIVYGLAYHAAGQNDLILLQYAMRVHCNTDWVCAKAARHGYLQILKYAREHGCAWDEDTCRSAAKGGYLGILQWAHKHHCPWDARTCDSAAEGGHLGILQWARQHGCPWDEFTCSHAAMGGHLNILQWARQHGCHWGCLLYTSPSPRD